MIKGIEIKNFRSLKDVRISLERDITVLIGENDSGKTSIVDSLKIMFDTKKVGIDDFFWNTKEICIKVELEDGRKFIKKFLKNDEDDIQEKTFVEFSPEFLEEIKNNVTSENFDSLEDKNKREKLFCYARELGLKFKSNIRTDSLKKRVIAGIDEILSSKKLLRDLNIPNYSIYFLDGKHFESLSTFFQEVFFKEKSKDIWYEEVEEGKTVEKIIKEKLENYAENLENEVEEKGIKDKLKSFLPEFSSISITPVFEPKDIKIGVKVQLLEKDGREILVEKKGDGTKRRITMALLEYKKGESALYVFDEPDTHLHVKAQVELLNVIRQLSECKKQIIITTHSPFIMNAVKPGQIRLLLRKNGETKVKSVSQNEDVERILRSLGIENINLFFSKKILIVEGETEEVFIPLIYEKLFNCSPYSNLVKIIKRSGITDVPRFAEVLLKFVKPEDIFILTDNDADSETQELIEKLEIPDENKITVGNKEFEDAFDAEVIYEAWKNFVVKKGKRIGDSWTIDNIEELKRSCISNGEKFSKKLKELNKPCLVSMKKPKLAQALAEYCEEKHLPKELLELLKKLK